ncbi:MAG TPA: DUF4838 domain-containing protein [Candidatus Hydrogenedentes bacterium]|mgnify:CR=1 FL=1|nr:DUF4838 domain-containing protein [Candidatus Hydrogenedentota bacterium]
MIRNALIITFAIVLCSCATAPNVGHGPSPFVVAKEGVAACRIVVGAEAPPSTKYAAEELQRFLGEITGATFEVVPDTVPLGKNDIIVGCNRHFDKIKKDAALYENLGTEGYAIQNTSGHLLIAGGEPRGTLYGVYALLEERLGCRWFTPTVSRIPKQPTLSIAISTHRAVPKLEYREPFVADCFDGDWAARNRMNSSTARLEEKHGGKVTYHGFVHTFESLVPPDTYFDTHPEYFSLVKGERLKVRSQLCCTNEEVIQIIIDQIHKRMRDNPDATVFSVSQNDWLNYCECEPCTALATAEGSQIAPVLQLVNRVAKSVAQEFPDKLIDTLAYQYTRKPPKTMRAEPNVIIRLCSIECCFSHSFVACDSPENIAFEQDVIEWGKICNRLWVWNYNTSFADYFMPYPNLRVRNDNIRFFSENNVKGIFEQDVYTTVNGELSGLSGYLNAKMLWDYNYDEDTAINEFLDAVYGKAAPSIREYIDLLHNRVEAGNIHMDIWIGPQHPLLDHGVLELADHIWDEAESRVADEPEVLERVRAARLSLDFAIIERERTEGLRLYEIDQHARTLRVKPEFAARVQRFFEVAERSGVTNLREHRGALDEYRKQLDKYQTIVGGPTRDAVKVSGLKPGLRFRGYDGVWEQVPDFATLKPVEDGVANAIGLSVTQRREALGLAFNGYLHAPVDGIYLFHLRSNDGSKMYLGDELLIDNDGLHKIEVQSGIVTLKRGYHPVRVEYFESGGQEGLDLFIEGPGIEKQAVPASMMWHSTRD